MNYYANTVLITELNERKKNISCARNTVLLCMSACALFLLLPYLISFLTPEIVSFLKGLPFISENTEIANEIINMLLYVIMLIIPFGFAALLLNKLRNSNSQESEPVSRATPRLPFLFLFGTLGLSYLTNIIVSSIFGGVFDRFAETDAEFPVSALGIVLCFIRIAVLPALLEEWAFRGVILKNLLPYGKWGAILVSSFLFGLMHIDPPRVIFATLFGIALGTCYSYTHSLKFCILIHMLNNTVSVMGSYLSSWENQIPAVILGLAVFALMGVGIASAIVFAIYGIKRKKISLAEPLFNRTALRTKKYVSLFFLNFGIIPLALMYAFQLYTTYFE